MVVHIDPARFNRTCPRCYATVHGTGERTCPCCGGSMVPSCVGCGYDLAGLAREAACPECGTPVERSYAPDLLENRSSAYLRQLSSGLAFVIYGTLCSLGLLVLMIPALMVAAMATNSSAAAERVIELGASLLGLLCTGAVLFGWWRITTPDPARVGTDLDVSPRRVVRATVVIQIAGELLSVATQGLSLSGGIASGSRGMEALLMAAELVAWVAWAVQFFAAMLYVRWLARRVPDPNLEQNARQLMWLGPLLFILGWPCLGIGPLIALILYLVALGSLYRHVRGMLARAELV